MEQTLKILNERETDSILELYEKKVAMENLSLIIDREKQADLFSALKQDYKKLMQNYQEWWEHLSTENGWEKEKLYINFSTREVIQTDEGKD